MFSTKNIIFSAFLGLIILMSACESQPGISKGNLAPDFKLRDVENKVHQLSEYRGKVVMVHFWTDWCNACRAEFPRIQDYYADLKGEDFEILAINVGQALATSLDFKSSFGVEFPMLLDEQKAIAKLYNIEGYPTNFFIDPEGKIIKVRLGWESRKQVEVLINQHRASEAKAGL